MDDFDETKCILNPDDFKDDEKRHCSGGRNMACKFCTQKSTGRKCVKKFYKYINEDSDYKKRFDYIISIIGTINHPAIVPFIGFYKEGDYDFIIEEEIENGSLHDELLRIEEGKKNFSLDETHKLIIIYGISCGMEFLHNKQIVHRNISSSNIFLNSELYPFLSGFTFSKKINPSINEYKFSISTPYIMAPELIEDPYEYGETFPIDVYSFGMIAYEIVTEHFPYQNIKSVFQIHKNVTRGQRPTIPSSVNFNWTELIQACWNQQPEKRPAFTEICNVLESYVFVNDRIDRKLFENYKKLVKPFRPSSQKIELTFNPFEEIFKQNENDENVFVDSDDQEFYKTVKKIGEGATSVVYKIIDTRTDQILCKKVLKLCDESSLYKNAKNAIKEFEILHKINHPSICKAIKINISEPIKTEANEQAEEEELTTISLYLEFLSRSLKESIDKKVLDNTLKVKIVIEIVHALNFIHKHGMIHRDIKIENIMLNSTFESKIVDFGLVRIDECLNGHEFVTNSMTKGVGTLSYMSPEMVNEEDYDNKTDVYSFGIVLHYIFLGKLPNYNIKDKMAGNPIPLPNPSSMISQFGLNLISKCTNNKPEKRPSFDQILKEIRDQSYLIAPEIDRSLISKRDRELSFFESLQNQK